MANIAEIGSVKSGVVFIVKRFRAFGSNQLTSMMHRPFVDMTSIMLQLRVLFKSFVLVSERIRT